jgi:hypothetical protein
MRALTLAPACVGAICVLAACGGGGGKEENACSPVQAVTGLVPDHVTTDPDSIPYSTNPPAGGPHTGTSWLRGQTEPEKLQRDAAPPTARLGVAGHSLEHGAVIAWTNKLSKQDSKEVVETMRSLAAADNTNPGNRYSELHVVENPKMDVPFALSAWGSLQKCKGTNTAAIRSFVEQHYGQGPEGVAIGCHNAQVPSCQRLQEINNQFQRANTALLNARNTFLSRANSDRGNLAAFKGDAAQFRTAIYNYDVNGLRKTAFPAYVRDSLNAVLERIRTVVSDLDAISSAPNFTEINRLLPRYRTDYAAFVRAQSTLARRL